jgi:hypothetical protein
MSVCRGGRPEVVDAIDPIRTCLSFALWIVSRKEVRKSADPAVPKNDQGRRFQMKRLSKDEARRLAEQPKASWLE